MPRSIPLERGFSLVQVSGVIGWRRVVD